MSNPVFSELVARLDTDRPFFITFYVFLLLSIAAGVSLFINRRRKS